MKIKLLQTHQVAQLAIVILFVILMLSVTSTITAESPEQLQNTGKYSYAYLGKTAITTQKSFSTALLEDATPALYKTSSKTLQETDYTVVEFTTTSSALILPDDTLVVTYGTQNKEILPQGSTIYQQDSHIYLLIADESTAIKVEELNIFSVENLTKTATYQQSIDTLDYYETMIELTDLENAVLSENIDAYQVHWGDGTTDTFSPEIKTLTHTYTKSGDYIITITIKDDFGYVHTITQPYTVEYEGHLLHAYFWTKENPEPVAASSTVGISSAAIGLMALTETGKYKLLALLPLLIPLYTRISKEDVLDQFVRGQVYGYIKTNPGVHYNQIRRGIGIKNGTLSYHLRVLEKTELIKSRREGMRYRAFYPTDMRFPKNERFRLTDLQIQIIDQIKEQPGITQKEIAKNLTQKPQTINYNIKVLEQAGLIEVRHKGRKTRIYSAAEEDEYLAYDVQ